MPFGPGKYDDLATYVRDKAEAVGVAIIIVGGNKGEGFAVQAPLDLVLKLPEMLRNMADEIERSGT